MRKQVSNQKGISLTEIIVGMSLVSILMAAALTMLGSSVKVFQSGKSMTEVQQAARLAVDAIVREVRYASNVRLDNDRLFLNEAPEAIDKQVIFGYNSATKTLVVKRGSGPPLPFAGDGVNDQEGTIIITENPGGAALFAVQPSDSNTKQVVKITVTVKDKISGITATAQSSVVAMNSK